jgi:hypothetical protein
LIEAVAVLCAIALLCFYKLYYKPKKLWEHYLRTFRAKGYKVKAYPFNCMGAPTVEIILRGVNKHKDATHPYKHDFAGYDIILINTMSNIGVTLINPTLGHELTTMENVMQLPKHRAVCQLMYSLAPSSLLFSEGKAWKERRNSAECIQLQLPRRTSPENNSNM